MPKKNKKAKRWRPGLAKGSTSGSTGGLSATTDTNTVKDSEFHVCPQAEAVGLHTADVSEMVMPKASCGDFVVQTDVLKNASSSVLSSSPETEIGRKDFVERSLEQVTKEDLIQENYNLRCEAQEGVNALQMQVQQHSELKREMDVSAAENLRTVNDLNCQLRVLSDQVVERDLKLQKIGARDKEIQRLQEDLAASRSTLRSKDMIVGKLNANIKDLQKQNNYLRSQAETRTRIIIETDYLVQRLKLQINQLDEDKIQLKLKLKCSEDDSTCKEENLTAQNGKNEAEIAQLKAERVTLKEKQKEIEEIGKELVKLQTETASKERDIANNDVVLQQKQQEICRLQEEIKDSAASKKSLVELEKENRILRAKCLDLDDQSSCLEDENKRLTGQLKIMSTANEELRNDMKDLKRNLKKQAVESSSTPFTTIHVSRLKDGTTSTMIRSYFIQYGDIARVSMPSDCMAFAFVQFRDPNVAKSVLEADHVINGKSVLVNPATHQG